VSILHRTAFFLIFLLLVFSPDVHSQNLITLTGRVFDVETGEALVAANIRIDGTSRGTITNSLGSYRIRLEGQPQILIFSSLSYQPDTLRISAVSDTVHDVGLKQSPIQLAEMLVLAEDPAIEIIRKAIANKQKWRDKLRSYQFEAYTRQLLRRDTSIASITESYSTGYMTSGDTMREIIRQKRQTQNVPIDENFASVGRIVNFNDDEISLFSASASGSSSNFTFVGPTARDALDNYDYKLLSTSTVNGIDIYSIRMTPKSRFKPLFDGTITIADGTFAVMGVDVRPNETFIIPFLRDIDLRYRQKFSLYDSLYWMPTDIRIVGGVTVSIVGFSLPRIGIDQTSSIYDYAVNVQIPDSILHQRRLRVDSTAAKYDSAFWQQNDVLPLTPEEQAAYKSIDSTQTLEKQFEPKGPLSSLTGNATDKLFSHLDLHFNRVEGFYIGGHMKNGTLLPHTSLTFSAGYGFSDDRFMYEVGATFSTGKAGAISVGGEVYRSLDHIPDADNYGTLPLSLLALIDKNDYRDYFFTAGWRSFVAFQPTQRLRSSATFISEQQYSMANATDYSLFGRENVFRANPPIMDGRLRSVELALRIGESPVPFDLISRNAAEVLVEHSSPSFAHSEFDFTRFAAAIQWNIRTFARALLFPPTFRINVIAGTSRGSLPPQRLFTPDTRAGILAPFGVLQGGGVKEFFGDRMVMLNVEHNFRSVPFILMNIPSFYKNGIELVLHASAAQTWLGSTSTSNGWYYDAGIGISRILDLLRVDLTYRFKEPSRLYVTLTLANFF